MRRLLEIEISIGMLDDFSLRRLVMDTEEYILQSQKSLLNAHRMKNGAVSESGGDLAPWHESNQTN